MRIVLKDINSELEFKEPETLNVDVYGDVFFFRNGWITFWGPAYSPPDIAQRFKRHFAELWEYYKTPPAKWLQQEERECNWIKEKIQEKQ